MFDPLAQVTPPQANLLKLLQLHFFFDGCKVNTACLLSCGVLVPKVIPVSLVTTIVPATIFIRGVRLRATQLEQVSATLPIAKSLVISLCVASPMHKKSLVD